MLSHKLLIQLKVFCFNCVLCESETNSHFVNDKFYCSSKWVAIFKNTLLMVLYQTQSIIKRLEQFVWVVKALQNKALKIIEQNITAKYFRYLKSPFLSHVSDCDAYQGGQKRLTTLK